MKKALSIILVFTLMFSAVALSRAFNVSAALGDGDELSVKINLELGTGSGADFQPVTKGQTFKTGDIITVRISPKSDFLCGVSSYVVMFDKTYFSIKGENKMAFTANKDNYYFSQVSAGYSGTTSIPDKAWPAELANAGENTVYKAVKVGVQANSNSANGGHPELISGEWLFQIRLTVLKDIGDGAKARVWMDPRWFRTPANTTADGYFAKCEDADDLSSIGSSTKYNFKYDFSGADIALPLFKEQPTTSTTKPDPATTTKPATTGSTTPGTTGSTKPGTTTTTKPGATTTRIPPVTRTEVVTLEDGSKVTETDKAGSTVDKTIVVYETVARTEYVTDKAGEKVTEKDAAGSTAYKTTVIYEKVVGTEYVTGEDGSKVFETDEAGSTIYQTTLIYETVDENGNIIDNPDVEKKNLTAKKVIIIVLIVLVTFGAAALVINIFGKKK